MSDDDKIQVPIMKDYTYEGIQTYISDMKRTKEYAGFKNDKDLIFCSLIKSGKTSLYNDMGRGDDEDIEKFGLFLKNIMGLSQEDSLRRFQSLKQGESENGLRFYNRLVRMFYDIRNTTVPNKIEDKIHILEMTQAFIKGLRNIEVAKEIQRNQKTIGFENLGTRAMDLERVEKGDE